MNVCAKTNGPKFRTNYVMKFKHILIAIPALQTGKTAGKSNLDMGIHVSHGKYSQNSVLDPDGELDYKPVFGMKASYGVTERIDLGISLDQTTFLSLRFKYQFLGDQHSLFAASTGLESGFISAAFFLGNLTYYLSTPLFISVHPTEKLAFYVTPRFTHASNYIYDHPTGGQLGPGPKLNFLGITYGFAYGKKTKIALELSYYDNHILRPSQISLGLIFTE